jgi:Fe/S biogenesis protein NfuA
VPPDDYRHVPSSIVTITPAGYARLVELREKQPDGLRGLRLRVAAIDDERLHYDLRFDSVAKAAITDIVETHDGLKVVIAAADVRHLGGAVIDHTDSEGLVVRNDRNPAPGDETMIDDDDVACAVRDAIAFTVNPMLAEHGGFVSFVAHDGQGTAYLTMGGGCQGCALSALTMRDGVRAVLSEKVPAIQRVADITDHAAGTFPYYTEEHRY